MLEIRFSIITKVVPLKKYATSLLGSYLVTLVTTVSTSRGVLHHTQLAEDTLDPGGGGGSGALQRCRTVGDNSVI